MSEIRLIDADVLQSELDDYIDDSLIEISDVKELIDNASTIEGRPQGKWIEHKLRNDIVVEYAFKCSNCKKDSGLVYRTDFCPNCGADMRGKKDESENEL